MNYGQLIALLSGRAGTALRLQLPDGSFVPDHFHVTEVAHLAKRFIDCGGTLRREERCVLQVWTADDVDHRLNAGKLASVLKLADKVMEGSDPPVEFEYEAGVISQYPLESVMDMGGELVFLLGGRNTDCLAKEICLPAAGCDPKAGCC